MNAEKSPERIAASRPGRNGGRRARAWTGWLLLAFAGTSLAAPAPAPASCAAGDGSVTLTVGRTSPLTLRDRLHQAHRTLAEIELRNLNWPPQNSGPRPSLDEYLPEADLWKRVDEPVRMDQALLELYGKPVTDAELQAELLRQAEATKDPERLRATWAALGNDPALIAETMARPILAENRLRASYYADDRIHGEQEQEIRSALAGLAHGRGLKTLSGEYDETELRIRNEGESEAKPAGEAGARVRLLSAERWKTALRDLAVALGHPEAKSPSELAGAIGPLHEEEELITVVAVVEAENDRLRIGRMTWKKPSFSGWWESLRGNWKETETALGALEPDRYTLPSVPQKPMHALESWEPTAANGAPAARALFACHYTGTYMVVWGGCTTVSQGATSCDGSALGSGGRYNPTTDSWLSTSTVPPCPAAASGELSVWSGTEMIFWNGTSASGARYNPATDVWTAMTGVGAPDSRSLASMVWNGADAVVWGGSFKNTGARYTVASNSWTATATLNAPQGRSNHRAIWDGTNKMIVWGGSPVTAWAMDTGGQYNGISTSTWMGATPMTGVPTARYKHTMVDRWGVSSLVWGGLDNNHVRLDSGGILTGGTGGSWSAISTTNAPTARADHSALWCANGYVMTIWGGSDFDGFSYLWLDTGGRYDPSTNSWTAITTTGAPTPRGFPGAVDITNIGVKMIVWGGGDGYIVPNTTSSGGVYFACSEGAPSLSSTPLPTTTDLDTCTKGIRISWSADSNNWRDDGWGTRTYDVLRNGTAIATGIAYGTTTYTDSATTNGTTYSYVVRYNNGCGHSADTTGVNGTETAASAPSTLTNNTAADVATCADTGVTVTWAQDAGNWGDNGIGTRTYTVLRDGSVIASGGCSGSIAYATTTCNDTTGANGTTYTYSVRYNNGCSLNAATTGASAMDFVGATPSTLANNTAADVSACADSGVTVTWAADAGSWGDNGSGTRSYDVLRNGAAISTGIAYGTTTYTDTAGANGTAYTYTVRYDNGCSLNAATTGVSATDVVAVAPSALTNNTAADVSACADSGVTVTWAAPGNWGDNGSGTRTIDVLRGATPIATGLAATTTTYTDTTGANGTAYTYTVRFNNGCSLSATTTGASATDQVGAAPSSLTNNTAADVSACADSGVTVTWAAPGNWGDNGSGTRTIDVLRGATPIATGLAATTTTYTDTAGTNGTAYTYTVRFNNGCSLNASTTGASATDQVGAAPSSLTNNTATDVSACADSGVTVTWAAPGNWGDNGSGTRTIDVLRAGTPITTGLASTTTSYTDTTGTNGTAYTYTVRFNNGCSLNASTTGASATDQVGAAPSSLTNNAAADVSACADSGVTVTWAAPGNWGDNGSGTRTIDVLRAGTPIATGLAATTTTYTDTAGTNGTAYTYTVRFNNGCSLNASTTGASATDQVGAAPSSLTNNTAADVSACADSGVTVTWAAPGNWGDNGSGTRTIDVLRAGTPITTGLASTTTSYTDTTGTNGTAYTYTVRFNNGCSLNASTTGASATDQVGAAPSSLTNNTAADVSACTDSGVTITWAAPGNWGDNGSGTRTIDVLRGVTPIATGLAATATTYTDTTGTNGISYAYTVRFNNGCSLSATTTGVSATDQVGAAPSSLTNNTAADVSACADSGVTVNWVAPGNWGDNGSGTRTYTILRAGTPLASGGCSGSIASGTTTCTDTTGANGTAYTYTVRFNNGCGLNASTTGASATDVVDTTACPAVGNTLTLTDATANVSIGWNAVVCGDLANYRVYGATSYDAPFPSGWTLLGQPVTATTTDSMGSPYVVYKILSTDLCGNSSTY